MSATDAVPPLPAGLPESWLFDRDLPCPQCRYNLRMLRQPRCPECGTAFRWQAILHVGCPRCGEGLHTVDDAACPRCKLELNWERLLGETDPAGLKRYEYARRPFGAMVKTWFQVLRPRRFWKSIPIESPPVVLRLRRYRRLAWALALLGLFLLAAVEIGFTNWGMWRYWIAWASGGTGGSLRWLNPEIFWRGKFLIPGWIKTTLLVLPLPLITMLLLPRFTPTLARFHIRKDQLLRCLAYLSSGLLWNGLILMLVNLGFATLNYACMSPIGPRIIFFFDPLIWKDLDHFTLRDLVSAMRSVGWQPAAFFWPQMVFGPLLLLIAFIWWWRFLYVSLRHYLRLDLNNALALFFSTQIIGVLVVVILWTMAYNTSGR